MSFHTDWQYPEGHPISPEQARSLIGGKLGTYYRHILMNSCSPLFWHGLDENDGERVIKHNGTVTFASVGEEVVGITAAHVVRGFEREPASSAPFLQIGDAAYLLDVMAIDDKLDIATLRIPPAVIRDTGKSINAFPLPSFGDVPQEGRGIMLAGYPGEDMQILASREASWGLFTALGVARRVYEDQITWSPEHSDNLPAEGISPLRPHKNLGGISGGPLLAMFDKPATGLQYIKLAGIVVQASATIENVVARRLDTDRARSLFV